MMKKVSPFKSKIKEAQTPETDQNNEKKILLKEKTDEVQRPSIIVKAEKIEKVADLQSSPTKHQVHSKNFSTTSIVAMFSPKKIELENEVLRLKKALNDADQDAIRMAASYKVKEMKELSRSERMLVEQIGLKEKMTAMRGELFTAVTSIKELTRDNEYLTSERAQLVINLETTENELELCQSKLNKIEKEGKILFEERNNYAIQLKGSQKELQQISMEVSDIKNRELWLSMEGQLQLKDKAKAEEEKAKELLLTLASAKAKEEELLKKSAELRLMKNELFSSGAANKYLTGENEHLTSERSELVINLETTENELELCQSKLNKIEKERKIMLEERNNFEIQLKGARKELQQISLEVSDIKNRELWLAMESQLQLKDKAKAEEEKTKELFLTLASAKAREEELVKKNTEMKMLRSELSSTATAINELTRDKEYLTSERSELVINLETTENELELCQSKLNKIEKERKILLEERNNFEIQLKGSRKELQQISLEVSDIKNRELWLAMESQLQLKDRAKAEEEKTKELFLTLASAKAREEELVKKNTEMKMLRSELSSTATAINELTRDKEYLTSERSELVINLETTENELELCQSKLNKSEKEGKILFEERNNYAIQLKGSQKELQQISMEVSEIKNKELWKNMEDQLQTKAAAEKEEEMKLAIASSKAKDQTIKTQNAEYSSKISILQSNVYEKTTIINNLQRDLEYLNTEKLSIASTLDTVENELELSVAKFLQIERDKKLLQAGRDSMSVQLKGCQKELQQLSQVVEDIRAKESWGAMELQLQNQSK